MEPIRCRICDSALCLASPVGGRTEDGFLAARCEVRLEDDGTGQHFICPYCSARNITIVTTGQDGRTAVQVAWAVMNAD